MPKRLAGARALDALARDLATRPHQRSLSPAVDDYTKAIDTIARATGLPVATSDLAERLAVRPASVSSMLRKLDDLGYLEYVPYRGVRLSSAGEAHARSVIRRHRLIERFLYDTLGVPWDEVHDEAERLEHAVSVELCERISAHLGSPAYDPHGDPIPTADGSMALRQLARLVDLPPIEQVRVARVSDRDARQLRALRVAGIGLHSVLSVASNDRRGVTVHLGAAEVLLPRAAAEVVFVEDTVRPARFATRAET